MAWTTPTPRSFDDLITASIWNVDLVANLILLKTSISNDGGSWLGIVNGTTGAFSGTCSIAGTTLLTGGSAGTPGLAFTADSLTGIWYNPLSGGLHSVNVTVSALNALAVQSGVAMPSQLIVPAKDNAALAGHSVWIGHNSNASTPGAGSLSMNAKDGTVWTVWPDVTGVLRIATGGPGVFSTTDTTGTIVGTQTSTRDAKLVLLEGDLTPADALATMLATPVRRFIYRSQAYGGQAFHGIIADEAPAFVMDPDAAHPEGRSFNPVSSFGFTIQAIKQLAARLTDLEARAAC